MRILKMLNPQTISWACQRAAGLRGFWTLQELIAPADVQFFSNDWQKMASKRRLASALSRITRVNKSVLNEGLHVYKASVAEKMSWAANRETTRIEDRVYLLLGLFGVNMPTLYGEGARAFTRLQNEIIKISSPHTISTCQRKSLTTGLLAHSPDEFENSNLRRPLDHQVFHGHFWHHHRQAGFHTNELTYGMHIQLPLAQTSSHNSYYFVFPSRVQSADKNSNELHWLQSRCSKRLEQGKTSTHMLTPSTRGHYQADLPGRFTRTRIMQNMLGNGRCADYTCTLEPAQSSSVWVDAAVLAQPTCWRNISSFFLHLYALLLCVAHPLTPYLPV